jgi:lipopolysaccharide biosynthesis regulator YciM
MKKGDKTMSEALDNLIKFTNGLRLRWEVKAQIEDLAHEIEREIRSQIVHEYKEKIRQIEERNEQELKRQLQPNIALVKQLVSLLTENKEVRNTVFELIDDRVAQNLSTKKSYSCEECDKYFVTDITYDGKTI